MSEPVVSAVVVTYQSEQFIADCLDSMLGQTRPFAEITVVDNGSSDRTAEIVRARGTAVRFVELGRNTGFCRANNIGIAGSRSEFVLVANPDTRMNSDYVERAVAAFETDPRVGIVAGKLLRFDGITIDSAGQMLTRSRKIQDRGYDEFDAGQYNSPADVDAACGAMALYRRAMIDEVSIDGQFFDEDFFAFCEDMDAGWRAKRLGWKAVYEPGAVAFHFRGGSQERHTPWTYFARIAGRPGWLKYHIVKNRWLMIIKNDSAANYLLNAPLIWARDIALAGYLAVSSPLAFLRLVAEPEIFVRAFQKRGKLLRMIRNTEVKNSS